ATTSSWTLRPATHSCGALQLRGRRPSMTTFAARRGRGLGSHAWLLGRLRMLGPGALRSDPRASSADGGRDAALLPILMPGPPPTLVPLSMVIERVVSRGPRLAGGRDEQARPIQRYRLLPTTQVPTILLGTIERGSSKVRRKTYHCPVEATIDVIGGK